MPCRLSFSYFFSSVDKLDILVQVLSCCLCLKRKTSKTNSGLSLQGNVYSHTAAAGETFPGCLHYLLLLWQVNILILMLVQVKNSDIINITSGLRLWSPHLLPTREWVKFTCPGSFVSFWMEILWFSFSKKSNKLFDRVQAHGNC